MVYILLDRLFSSSAIYKITWVDLWIIDCPNDFSKRRGETLPRKNKCAKCRLSTRIGFETLNETTTNVWDGMKYSYNVNVF